MSRLSRLLSTVLGVTLLCVCSSPATAEMYQYVDSQGRLHFTQDIGQVPPEYRDQVEKKTLRKEISVPADQPGAGGSDARLRAMKRRSQQLRQSADQSRRRHARPAPASRLTTPRNPLEGAPEPHPKYITDCEWNSRGEKKCRRSLTPQWEAWNRANGGNNGKPDIRRKVGED